MLCYVMLRYVRNDNQVIFSDPCVYHSALFHSPLLWDGSYFLAVFFSRWSVQCAPASTSCSCCAAAWQAAGRSLDGSSSAGASGPTVSFLWVLRWLLLPSDPGQCAWYERAKTSALSRSLTNTVHNGEHIWSVGDVCWYLLKQTTWICCSKTNNRCDTRLCHLAPVSQTSQQNICSHQGVCSHCNY